jgi:hypothetical protein
MDSVSTFKWYLYSGALRELVPVSVLNHPKTETETGLRNVVF